MCHLCVGVEYVHEIATLPITIQYVLDTTKFGLLVDLGQLGPWIRALIGGAQP